MLEIPLGFSVFYGLGFGNIADHNDWQPFNLTQESLAPFLPATVQFIQENAEEHREISVVRPWLELLIASSSKDVQAFGLRDMHGISDIVLPHPGMGLHIDEWHLLFECVREALFRTQGPMTAEEKARIKREVTITNDLGLDEFRARRAAAGLLDPETPE